VTFASVCVDAAGVGAAAVVAGQDFAKSWVLANVTKGATTCAAVDHVSALQPAAVETELAMLHCCASPICQPSSCQHPACPSAGRHAAVVSGQCPCASGLATPGTTENPNVHQDKAALQGISQIGQL